MAADANVWVGGDGVDHLDVTRFPAEGGLEPGKFRMRWAGAAGWRLG